MPHQFVLRRIDVLLVDLVQRLGVEYPELLYGEIARCVDAVRGPRECPPDVDVADVVDAVELAVRVDLDRMRAAQAATGSF